MSKKGRIAAPKQIAMRHCDACGHVGFADDVNRLDQIAPRTCDECNAAAKHVTVHLYRYEKAVA
jgi:hypothetical protein